MAKSVQDVMALIREQGIRMVDFKMVDINGQYRHVTIPAENFSEDIGLGFAVETRFLRENDTVSDTGSEYERDVFRKDVVATAEECVRLGQLHEKEGCTRGRTEGELGGLTGCVDELYDVTADFGFERNVLNGCADAADGFHVGDGVDLVERVHAAAVGDDVDFFFFGRIAHGETHCETVELCFRKRIGTDVTGRVLGCDIHERVGNAVGRTVNRNLRFFHCFEKRGLRLRGSTVDFVREENVRHNETFTEFEFFLLTVVYVEAGDVGCHNVGGELCAVEVEAGCLGKSRRDGGFTGARYVFNQNVTAGEHCRNEKHDFVMLTDDDLLYFRDECLRGLVRGFVYFDSVFVCHVFLSR